MQEQRSRRCVVMCIAVGALALGAMTLVANSAQAASGNGPYYAEPSWSQKLPAATRFVVLTDWNSDAVLDRNTGLVWEQSPNPNVSATWNEAVTYCIQKTIGGQKGWRLPAVAELASLIDPSVAAPGPTLPLGHPFTNVKEDLYWSATTRAGVPSEAWFVRFLNSNVDHLSKEFRSSAWCVRGGMNADQY